MKQLLIKRHNGGPLNTKLREEVARVADTGSEHNVRAVKHDRHSPKAIVLHVNNDLNEQQMRTIQNLGLTF